MSCSLVSKAQTVKIVPDTLAHRVYQKEEVTEEFRCNYGLNPEYRDRIDSDGLRVAGVDTEGAVRIIELPDHRFFIATLFLPQLSTSVETPHPIIVAYLEASLA